LFHIPISIESQKRLRYVSLLAAGITVSLGLVMLGDLTGLLWHVRTLGWWISLNPSILGPAADWILFAAALLISISPVILALARRRMAADPVVVLTSFVFPISSLAVMSWSYDLGATLLVGSGFLAAYTLVSRSGILLGIDSRSALRVVCTGVFALLTLAAAGGVASVLLWNGGVFPRLRSVSSSDPLDICLIVDVELFYLARPLLSAIFITLAVAAIVALFREPFESLGRLIIRRLVKKQPAAENHLSPGSSPRSERKIAVQGLFPYVIVVAAVLLSFAITLYPYTVAGVEGVLGSDSWWYLENLGSMSTFADVIPLLQADRGFFLIVLFSVRAATGLSPEWVVRLMPPLLSALLALSTFTVVKEGTGGSWVAAFAALLSVVSAQTALGMGAGIITNWFALSIASFMFALIVRSIRLHSKLALAGSVVVSLVLLASYAFLWVVAIAELFLALVASILALRMTDRRERRYEVGFMVTALLGSILIPVAFVFLVAMQLLGFRPAGLDPFYWVDLGWSYFVQGATPQVLGLALAALEEAFDFAGTRVDLPFLTLLSIAAMIDTASQRRSFRRIIAATILVPVAITVITPGIYHTWRGLYIIPLYLTAALGVHSIVRRVNGQESPWKDASKVAFTGTFAAYIILSQLAYSLRALELLIIVGSR